MSTCGHINKHYYNPDGVLEDLVCTKEAGHEPVLLRTENIKGDDGKITTKQFFGVIHSAEYKYKKVKVMPPLKQRVEGKPVEYEIATGVAEWLDSAGEPAVQQE